MPGAHHIDRSGILRGGAVLLAALGTAGASAGCGSCEPLLPRGYSVSVRAASGPLPQGLVVALGETGSGVIEIYGRGGVHCQPQGDVLVCAGWNTPTEGEVGIALAEAPGYAPGFALMPASEDSCGSGVADPAEIVLEPSP